MTVTGSDLTRILHPSAKSAVRWSALLALCEVAILVRCLAYNVPITAVTRVIGTAPTESERVGYLGLIALLAFCRVVFALRPDDMSLARMNAIAHVLELGPMTYLYAVNIFATATPRSLLDPVFVARYVVVYAAMWFNAAFFCNFWFDRAQRGYRSPSASVAAARDASVPTTARVAAVAASPPKGRKASVGAPTPSRSTSAKRSGSKKRR